MMKRALAVLMVAAGVAVLLFPLAMNRSERDDYVASGRALAFPEIEPPHGTIAVNLADLYELTELPGVGETIGQRIIDERESRGSFQYPEDLLAVSGIGEKTLEGMRDFIDMTLPDEDE